jgi:predicted CXXCH cytochrome family protein
MLRRTSVGIFLLATALVLSSTPASAQDATGGLGPTDCVKCHSSQPADIEAGGGKHKTAINCQNCHAKHRPASARNIPQCTQCHTGQPHFELKGCLGCHTNPHTPRKTVFTNKMTQQCLTCHTSQYKALQEFKSKHTAKNCTECHDVHRKKPECTQCHKPHSADITAEDCMECHKAHEPRNVAYDEKVEPKFCGACHRQIFVTLSNSKTKHAAQKCATCHKEKHKMVPRCQDCHGDKHPAGIMAKFGKCTDCHKSPHDLNNWASKKPAPAGKKGAAATPAAAPAE